MELIILQNIFMFNRRKTFRRWLGKILSFLVIFIFFSSPVLASAFCQGHLADHSLGNASSSTHEDHQSHHHAHNNQPVTETANAGNSHEHHSSGSEQGTHTCCSDGTKKDFVVSSSTELSFHELSKKISLELAHPLLMKGIWIQSLRVYTHYGTYPPGNFALVPLYTQNSNFLI